MNVETNHLVDEAFLRTLRPEDRKLFETVPTELQPAARKVLAGRGEAHVSRRSGGKLSRYAARRRKEKAQARRQQRRSRARNR